MNNTEQEQESKYLRVDLGVYATSKQLVKSYIDGRVPNDELLEKDGKKYHFYEIVLIDPIIYARLGNRLAEIAEKRPKPKGFSSIKKRLYTFWKIVLAGEEDSLRFLEYLAIKDQIIKEKTGIISEKEYCIVQNQREIEKKTSLINVLYDNLCYLDSMIKTIMANASSQKDIGTLLFELEHIESTLSEFDNKVKSYINNTTTNMEELRKNLSLWLDFAEKLNNEKTQFDNQANEITIKMQSDYNRMTNEIRELRDSVVKCIQDKVMDYSVVLTSFGNFTSFLFYVYKECFQPNGNVIFVRDSGQKVPHKALTTALWAFGRKTAINEIVAFYDDTFFHSGKKGILVTLRQIFVFDGNVKKGVREISYFCNSTLEEESDLFSKKLKYNGEVIAKFGAWNKQAFKAFVDSINQFFIRLNRDYTSSLLNDSTIVDQISKLCKIDMPDYDD